jgi:hypothetical protein
LALIVKDCFSLRGKTHTLCLQKHANSLKTAFIVMGSVNIGHGQLCVDDHGVEDIMASGAQKDRPERAIE